MKKLKAARTEDLVRELQCPGCMIGHDLCDKYKKGSYGQCVTHFAATYMGGAGKIVLGMPRGFNRPGFVMDVPEREAVTTTEVQTWKVGNAVVVTEEVDESAIDTRWDHLNIPVARAEWDGRPVVMTWAPRINHMTMLMFNGKLPPAGEEKLAGVPWLSSSTLDPEGPSKLRTVNLGFKATLPLRFWTGPWTGGERPAYFMKSNGMTVLTDPAYALKPDAGAPAGIHAVWGLERDGLLFVRACLPDAAETWVDVVVGGSLARVAPQAIDVGKFYGEID